MKLIILTFLSLLNFSYAKDCSYSIKPGSEKIEFTGYKFTSKVGVKGSFKNFVINAPKKSDSIEKIIENSSFWIDQMSLDAGNAARNSNISKGLLKNLPTDSFRGYVKSMRSEGKAKLLDFVLVVGQKQHNVELIYNISENNFLAEGKIDLLDLGYKEGFQALQKLCKAYHKGKDGKSITWSEVALRVSANFTCDK